MPSGVQFLPHTLMDKQNKNLANDPDYMKPGDLLMERLNHIDISQISSLEGQTRDIVLSVRQSLNGFNKDNLWQHLPKLGLEEASRRAMKAIVSPLKQISESNPFLSEWNEITAKDAAKRLGLPSKRLDRLIAQNGPTAQKLRDAQARVSKVFEAEIAKSISQDPKSDIVFSVAFDTWMSRLINNTRQMISETAPNLAKEEREGVISDTLAAFVKILDFATGQEIPENKLLRFLLEGRLGKDINIIDLHCLSFLNSPEGGIKVADTAEDFIVTDAESNRLVISQKDFLDNISRFVDILSAHQIPHRVIVLVIDNDKFVMGNQEKNIQEFLCSFAKVIKRHPVTKRDVEIVRASTIVDLGEFQSEWEKLTNQARIKGLANTLTQKIEKEEFERLQKRTLPSDLKTREAARNIAQKSFLLQMSFGSKLPTLFEPAIVLQSAKAHQQATTVFRLGAKMVGEEPVIITHWKGRQKLC